MLPKGPGRECDSIQINLIGWMNTRPGLGYIFRTCLKGGPSVLPHFYYRKAKTKSLGLHSSGAYPPQHNGHKPIAVSDSDKSADLRMGLRSSQSSVDSTGFISELKLDGKSDLTLMKELLRFS